MHQVKVLLVQLASAGDCLFVTTIARQIKNVDYPGCHLTWMIGSRYRQVLDHNPLIDALIEVPISTIEDIAFQRSRIPELVANAGGTEKFQKIFITDFCPANIENWFGTTRSSLFRSYPHKLRVPIQPEIFLTQLEIERVSKFCAMNGISSDTFNILFECSPHSFQSNINFSIAKDLAEQLTTKLPRVKIVLSSNHKFQSSNVNVVDGSTITWRENAELANYCNLLVGCSSGISWLVTSNHVKKQIPMIQVFDYNYMDGRISASIDADFRFFDLRNDRIIEMNNPPPTTLRDCIYEAAFNYAQARKRFNMPTDKPFYNFSFLILSALPLGSKVWITIKSTGAKAIGLLWGFKRRGLRLLNKLFAISGFQ